MDLLGLGVLEQIAERAGLERLRYVGLFGVHAENEHAQIGEPPMNLARRLDAVQIRHEKVEEQDIGTLLQAERYRLLAA